MRPLKQSCAAPSLRVTVIFNKPSISAAWVIAHSSVFREWFSMLSLGGKRAGFVVTLTCNLDFFRSRFLTAWTAVFFASQHGTATWHVRTLVLLTCRYPFQTHNIPPLGDGSNQGLATTSQAVPRMRCPSGFLEQRAASSCSIHRGSRYKRNRRNRL